MVHNKLYTRVLCCRAGTRCSGTHYTLTSNVKKFKTECGVK